MLAQNLIRHWKFSAIAFVVVLSPPLAASAQLAPPAEPIPAAAVATNLNQVGEPLTSGPIHEAFAQPTQYDAEHPLIVGKKPPEAIDEIPPDVKPEGNSVVWISGYWGWDDERRDFIWISGIWRDSPPRQVWVAGYWTAADKGYQWVPGFWTSEQNQQISYLPQPPESPNEAPNIPAPDANDFWVTGNWVYADAHYSWRPGYWAQPQVDWLWNPPNYVWSPNGYVYTAGYWDHPLADRGVLFAPTYFANDVLAQPNFSYTPSIALDTGLLTLNLFARPSYDHYYYGDYYGQNYASFGIQPWYSYNTGGRVAYDPLFSYYRSYNGERQPEWFDRQRERFTYLNTHPDARPSRTFAQEQRFAGRERGDFNSFTSLEQNRTMIAAPYRQFIDGQRRFSDQRPEDAYRPRFANVDRGQRQVLERQTATSRDFGRQRAQFERGAVGGGRDVGVARGPNEIGGRDRKTLDVRPLLSSAGVTHPISDARGVDPRTVLKPTIDSALEPRAGTTIEPRINRPDLTKPNISQEPKFNEPRGGGALTPQERNPNARGGPRPDDTIRNPPTVNPRESLAPRNLEPRGVDPRITDPKIPEPKNILPKFNDPRTVEPRPVVPKINPRSVEPRKPDPTSVAPRVIEPRVEPRAIDPRGPISPREPSAIPRTSAPNPKPNEAISHTALRPEIPAIHNAEPKPAPREAVPHQHADPTPRARGPAPQSEPHPHTADKPVAHAAPAEKPAAAPPAKAPDKKPDGK